MAPSFSPNRQDVERYRRFRGLGIELSRDLVKTIPKRAYDEVGDAIGILHNGVLVFDTEDMSGVLMDCCLHDWYEKDDRNLVEQYADTRPTAAGTDDDFLLNAYTQAQYRVLSTDYSVPDAGVYCHDLLSQDELFLMDVAFSRSLGSGDANRMAIATRTIPLGEYSMTTGAFLPITSPEVFKNLSLRGEGRRRELLDGPGGMALLIVRACIAAGAADFVEYEQPGAHSRKARIEPRFQFKRRRRT